MRSGHALRASTSCGKKQRIPTIQGRCWTRRAGGNWRESSRRFLERRPKSPIDLEAFVTPLEVFLGQFRIFPSREDLLGRASNDPVLLLLWAGEFRRALPLLQQHALRAAELGAMANAVR